MGRHQSNRIDAALSSPPHGVRLLSFLVDAAIVAIIAFVAGGGWSLLIGTFVLYHSASLWLTGQTVGKAIGNLELRSADGSRLPRTPRSVALLIGRSSVGYAIVDACGLGVLLALPQANRARRCLHDWVFGTRVVMRDDFSWALPRLRQRLLDFANNRRAASAAVQREQEETRRVAGLWHWLVTGALALEQVLDAIQRAVGHIAGWFGGPSPATGSSVLSTKAAASVAIASSAVTAGAITGLATWADAEDASFEGRWGLIEVKEVGSNTFEGRMSEDTRSADGCLFESGQLVWRFAGTEQLLNGAVIWARLSDGECTGFEWGPATFELRDRGTEANPGDDVLRQCSINPRTDVRACHRLKRN